MFYNYKNIFKIGQYTAMYKNNEYMGEDPDIQQK